MKEFRGFHGSLWTVDPRQCPGGPLAPCHSAHGLVLLSPPEGQQDLISLGSSHHPKKVLVARKKMSTGSSTGSQHLRAGKAPPALQRALQIRAGDSRPVFPECCIFI